MSETLPVPQAIALLQEYFLNTMEQKKLHSFYTCSGKCSDLPESEKVRIHSQKKANEGKKKGVDMFKHTWLTDRKTSFCEKTGK